MFHLSEVAMWILFGVLAWFVLSVPFALLFGLFIGAHKLHAEGVALPGADQRVPEHAIADHGSLQQPAA